MKAKTFLIVLLALALMSVGLLIACKAPEATSTPAPTPTPTAPTPTPTPAPEPTQASTQAPQPKYVSARGSLAYTIYENLTFGTSGKVSEINVIERDKVAKGQVLAKLDAATPLELAVKSAKVDLDEATNNYTQLVYPYNPATFSMDVPTALAYVANAQGELNQALKSLAIGLSSDQYSQVQQQLNKVQDDLTEAQQSLGVGQGGAFYPTSSGVSFFTIRAAQLEMEKAQAALDTANYNLGNAIIIAPFDGVIAQVNVILGDFLSPENYGTKIAIEIIDPSRIELDANVNEIDMPNVKLGQKVNIMLDALPNEQIEGTVYSIVPWPTVEGDVVSYEVKISVDIPEGSALQAGMSGEADIMID